MGSRWWCCVALVLLPTILAAPAPGSQCSIGCRKRVQSNLHYEEGHSYTYKLDATTETRISGAPDSSKLHITGRAIVSAEPDCDFYLRLEDLKVTGPDGKEYTSLDGSDHPVSKFSYQDGVVENLCSSEVKPTTYLNVKRGVISLLQVSVRDLSAESKEFEVDVFGRCMTEYKVSRSDNEIKVNKHRDLNSCVHRSGGRTFLQGTPYFVPSYIQNIPLLNATLNCEQTVRDGVVQSVDCSEDYLYLPFSKEQAGALANVHTKLTLESHQKHTEHFEESGPLVSIVLDHSLANEDNSQQGAVTQVVKNLCNQVNGGVHPDAPDVFAHLVSTMRGSNLQDLSAAYAEVVQGAVCGEPDKIKSLFLSALPMVGTTPSVQLMARLLQDGTVTGLQEKFWYTSFSFVRQPTLEVLDAVFPLVDVPNPTRVALLGVGGLAGRTCKKFDCTTTAEFQKLETTLIRHLGYRCQTENTEDQRKVLGALKSLGNVGKLTENAANALRECAIEPTLADRTRVAALQAAQGDACKPQLKSAAMDILRDIKVNSEVRIEAFLVLTKCPCPSVVRTIQDVLDTEVVNQVGSFISSYIASIQHSTSRNHFHSRDFLKAVKLHRRFPVDIRKYSQHVEWSDFSEEENFGETSELSVIYSTQSYIPRSSRLNLTVDLFGTSVNLFELGIRLQNLEYPLESLFGPRGYFPDKSFEKAFKSDGKLNKLGETLRNRYARSPRNTRSVSEYEINLIDEKVKLREGFGHEAEVDLSLKMFGNEFLWLDYHGDPGQTSADDISEKIFHCIDKLISGAKSYKTDLTRPLSIVDATLTYPTAIGLPFKVDIKGTAVLSLKLEGNLDLQQIMNDPKNAEIKSKVIPSAAVQISSSLSFDTNVVETGVKFRTTVHTSTGLDLSLKVLNGNGVDLRVDLPGQKEEVLNVKSELFKVTREHGHEEVTTPLIFGERVEVGGCYERLSKPLGLAFCGQYVKQSHSEETGTFPLSGPSELSLVVEKRDLSMQGFHFRAVCNHDDPSKKSFEIFFDTPGSESDRKVSVKVESTSEPNKEVKVELLSPWKALTVEGKLINTDESKSVYGRVVNDGQEYTLRTGVDISTRTRQQEYIPVLEYSTPSEGKTNLVEGKLLYVKNKKVEFNLKPSGPIKDANYGVKGKITIENVDAAESHKYTFSNIEIQHPSQVVKLEGFVSRDPKSVATSLDLTYGQAGHTLKFVGKLQTETRNALDNVKLDTELQTSKYPDLNFNLAWQHQWSSTPGSGHLSYSLTLVHGADLNSQTNRITSTEVVHFTKGSSDNFDVSYDGKFSYPRYAIALAVQAAATRPKMNYVIDITVGDTKISSVMDLRKGEKHPRDYTFDLKAQYNDRRLALHENREILSETESKFYTTLELTPGKKYEVTTHWTNVDDEDNRQKQVQIEVKIEGEEDNFKLDVGVLKQPKLRESHFRYTRGSVNVVVLEYKLGNPSGNAKAYIKDYLDGTAEFKAEGGHATSALDVNILSLNRRIVGSGKYDFGEKVNAVLDLKWDAENNPNQHLSVDIDGDYSLNDGGEFNLGLRTNIELIDKKSSVVLHLKRKPDIRQEEVSGSIEVGLPNGQTFSSSIHTKVNLSSDKITAEAEREIVVKLPSGATYTISSSYVVKREDISQVHVTYDTTISTPSYNEIKLHAVTDFDGDNDGGWNLITDVKVGGSSIPEPVELQVSSKGHKGSFEGKGLLKKGDKVTQIETILHASLDNPAKTYEVLLDLQLPSDTLSTLKIQTSGSYDITSPQNFEVKSKQSLNWNTRNNLELDISLKRQLHGLDGKVTLTVPQDAPRSLGVVINYVPETPKAYGSLSFAWGSGKESKLEVDVEKRGSNVHLTITAATPVKNYETLLIELEHKSLNDDTAKETDLTVTVSGRRIALSNKLDLNPSSRSIDLSVERSGETSRVFARLEKRAEHTYHLESRVDWVKGSLSIEGDVKAENTDELEANLNLNSDTLKINKWQVSISNIGTGGKRSISVDIKTGDGKVGSANGVYQKTEAGNTVTYRGALTAEYDGTKVSPTFLLETTKYTKAQDNEEGIQRKISFTLSSEEKDRQITWELVAKKTDRELHWTNSPCFMQECYITELYCKDKKSNPQEIDYEAGFSFKKKADEEEIGHSLTIITTKKDGNFEHKVDVILDLEKGTRTGYHIYGKPSEFGAEAIFPSRVLAVVGKIEHTGGKRASHRVQVDGWLNRDGEPDQKTTLTIQADEQRSPEGKSFNVEGRLQHPSLQRDMLVKGKVIYGGAHTYLDSTLDLDLFQRKTHKVTLNLKVEHSALRSGQKYTTTIDLKSKGQNLDVTIGNDVVYDACGAGAGLHLTHIDQRGARRDSEIAFELGCEKLNVVLKSPKAVLLRLDSDLKVSETVKSVNTEIELAGLSPLVIYWQQNSVHMFKTKVYRKATPEKYLWATGGLLFDKTFELAAEHQLGVERKPLYDLKVRLTHPQLLSTHLTWDKDNLQEALETIKSQLQEARTGLHDSLGGAGSEAVNEISDKLVQLKKVLPNFSPVITSYKKQLEDLRHEVEVDEGFQDLKDTSNLFASVLSDAGGGIYQTLKTWIVEVSENWIEGLKRASERLEEYSERALEAIREALPKIRENLANAASRLSDGAINTIEALVQGIKDIVDRVSSSQGRIATWTRAIHQSLRDLTNKLVDKLEVVAEKFNSFIQYVISNLKESSLASSLAERYNTLSVRFWERVAVSSHKLGESLRHHMPTQELKDLVDSIVLYIENKARSVDIDDEKAKEEIYRNLVKALKSFLGEFVIFDPQHGEIKYQLPLPKPVYSLSHLSHAFKINYRRGYQLDYSSYYQDLLYHYRPPTHLSYWVPPFDAFGVIAPSGNFLTFDGKQYKFSSNCQYLLARDFVDGNFSLVIEFDDNHSSKLILSDGKDSVQINSDLTVLVNDKPVDLPNHLSGISTHYTYSRIVVTSTAGVELTCIRSSGACTFEMSGFYFGKTAGLLGTYNYEQYDDYILTNGQVAHSLEEIASDWQVNRQCQAQLDISPPTTSDPLCTDLFSDQSKLRHGYRTIDPEPYTTLCNSLVHAADSKDHQRVACDVALTYARVCKSLDIKLHLPDSCISCDFGDKHLGKWDTVDLNEPSQLADVVFVVEERSCNQDILKDMLAKLITSLPNDLSTKGINDVQYALIGYGGKSGEKPEIYTIRDKLKFDGKTKNIQFSDSAPEDEVSDAFKALKYAVYYPFREGASKAVVLVACTKCTKDKISIKHDYLQQQFLQRGVSLHVVSPIELLVEPNLLKKYQKTPLIGFDAVSVYKTSDVKKKVLTEDESFRGEISYNGDQCTDLAEEVGGSVFDSKAFDALKGPQRKQYLQVLSLRVANSLTPENCQHCKCVLEKNLLIHTLCTPCTPRKAIAYHDDSGHKLSRENEEPVGAK